MGRKAEPVVDELVVVVYPFSSGLVEGVVAKQKAGIYGLVVREAEKKPNQAVIFIESGVTRAKQGEKQGKAGQFERLCGFAEKALGNRFLKAREGDLTREIFEGIDFSKIRLAKTVKLIGLGEHHHWCVKQNLQKMKALLERRFNVGVSRVFEPTKYGIKPAGKRARENQMLLDEDATLQRWKQRRRRLKRGRAAKKPVFRRTKRKTTRRK